MYKNDVYYDWSQESMMEVKLKEPSDFTKIMGALTRIGVATKDGVLYQSCHILHKKGKYYIMHFKELFALDGNDSTITWEDIKRRNFITNILKNRNLVTVIDEGKLEPMNPNTIVTVVKYDDRDNWVFKQKYQIGQKKKGKENG